jgi:hypothetical protein
MADDDDDIQRSGFEPKRGPSATDIATIASAALAAIAGGIAVGIDDLLVLAEEDEGNVDIPGRSACVESFKYNVHTGDLLLTLTDGSEWPYHRVPRHKFLEFINGDGYRGSQGRYYNLEVRGRWT